MNDHEYAAAAQKALNDAQPSHRSITEPIPITSPSEDAPPRPVWSAPIESSGSPSSVGGGTATGSSLELLIDDGGVLSYAAFPGAYVIGPA